jgi:hypothetical protein
MGYALGLVGIAIAIVAYSQGVELPEVEPVSPLQPKVGINADAHLIKTPPRATKGLDLVKLGWSYDCMKCHRLLKAKWHYKRPMVEHTNIELQHGNNRFCLNCHHPTNRNVFVDYDGSEISEKDVNLLCARCHGTKYRDWEAGAHGRRNGYWDKSRGPQTSLQCIQCHDPHHPKYKAMQSLPGLSYPKRAHKSKSSSEGSEDHSP